MRLLYSIFFFYTSILPATEYVYPVASLGNGERVLYIHQHSSTNIELLEWNSKTNQTEQILWSIFNPAGLEMLPDNSGFSFIDNGRLRIKLFQKRSAKAIDFDEPLFGINSVHWIDEHTGYCSARYNDNFALFELYDNGTLQCLRAEKGKDVMYPQKVGNQIFYIERCATENVLGDIQYHITSISYQNSNLHSSEAKLITNFYSTPIVFLTMTSEIEGFVVEHTQSIDSDDITTPFAYHHIRKEGDVWHKNLLFSFSIPTNLFLSAEERLYESILPLLPCIINNKVYFVDCAKNKDTILEPYFYDLKSKITQKINVATQKGHCFVPMLCGNTLYFGGTKLDGKKGPLISILT